MKHKILILCLLISGFAYGQTIPGYLKQNTKQQNIAQWSDSASGVTAYNGTPFLRVGVSTRSGQWGVDSVGHQFWFYSDTWLRLIKFGELSDTAAAIRSAITGGGGGGGPTGTDFVQATRSANAVEIVGANIETYPHGTNTPGVVTAAAGKLIDNERPEVIPFSSVDNTNSRYVGFPSFTAYRYTIWGTYKGAANHVDNGSLPVMKSENGGQNWDSVNVLHAFGNDPNITAIGDTVFYCHTSGYSGKILIGYSLDGFKTKVLADSVFRTGELNYPFGKMIKKPSGKIAFLTYSVVGADYFVRIVESTDNGVSWDWHSLITSGTTAAPINLNEADWDIMPGATSDADCKILMVVRDEHLGGPQQWTSSDGYATWTYRGAIARLASAEDTYGFPTYVKVVGNDVYLVAAPRTSAPGISNAPDFYITALRGIVDSVFTDPTKWPLPGILYKSQDSYRGVGDFFDFGYSFPFVYRGVLMCAFYDVSPLRDPPAIWTRIAVMQLVGIYGLELYKNDNNQSIPDATETLVATNRVRLDTDLSYNSGTGLIEIKKDGWYNIHAVATFVFGTDGTYRRAYLKLIDPGETNNNRILAEDTKQATNNQSMMRFELRANSEFFHAGEKVGFYVIHDGGSGEELLNLGDEKYRSKISLKKQFK